MESEMTPQQADYCDRLSSGNIEVAVPCENALSSESLMLYCFELELEVNGLAPIESRMPHLAYTETTIIVNDILTGLGK